MEDGESVSSCVLDVYEWGGGEGGGIWLVALQIAYWLCIEAIKLRKLLQ